MSIILESKKAKRTGLIPTFLTGGILSAAVPVMNMAVRSEMYVGMDENPIQILLGANWNMMAMMNLLLITLGACILYHIEYADGAMQKMQSLPIRESKIYFEKAILLILMCLIIIGIEALAIGGCATYWFNGEADLLVHLVADFAYAFFMLLPVAMIALVIASVCKNMWISLGIGVVCIFAATMNPGGNFWISLFPYALPFEMLPGTEMELIVKYLIAMSIELMVAVVGEIILIKVRRNIQ